MEEEESPLVERAPTIVIQGNSCKAVAGANFFGVDDSKRPHIYLTYLIFTLIILPIWWYTTSVPRASPTFPPLEPHHELPRLSRVQVMLMNVNGDAWNSLAGQDLVLTPNANEQEIHQTSNEGTTVEVLHKVLVSVSQHHQPEGASQFDRSEFAELVKKEFAAIPDRPGEYRLYLMGGTEREISIHFDGLHRAILMTGAANDVAFDSPQEFLEKWLVHLMCPSYRTGRKEPQSGRVTDAARYLVTLTMIVGYASDDEQMRKLDWDIEAAAREYFLPLLASLEQVADFSVNYQIKAMARLPVIPQDSQEGRHLLDVDQLPIFVDETRWNFASTTVGAEVVTIDLLLFVPSPAQRPLLIRGREDDPSFRLAQWGAVYILNDPDHNELVSTAQLQPVMASFAGHVRALFGVGSRQGQSWPEGVVKSVGPNYQEGIGPFELDSLMTDLCLRRYHSALSTLQALRRLLDQYSEIAVLPPVGRLVTDALASLSLAEELWSRGSWREALIKAAHAQQLADAAFFHPTMMAHQYFPQEHKLGVYLPLFFPFVLPVVVATVSGSFSWIRRLLGRVRDDKIKRQ